jgi:hypothetical protein
MNDSPIKQSNPVLAGCMTLSVLAIMIGSVHALHSRETAVAESNNVVNQKPLQTTTPIPATYAESAPPSPTNATTPITPPIAQPPPTAPSYIYKDGNYSAVGTFTAPGVTDHLNVNISISKDVITGSTVTFPANTDPTSRKWDTWFITSYKPFVVGKLLAGLNLTTTGGASLTPIGFNDALAQIRATAHG